jgi:excisionase family DNA binding protein
MTDKDNIMRTGGYLSVAEAASTTGYSNSHVYKLVSEGKVAGAKHGSAHYVSIESLAEYMGPIAAKLCGLVE